MQTKGLFVRINSRKSFTGSTISPRMIWNPITLLLFENYFPIVHLKAHERDKSD